MDRIRFTTIVQIVRVILEPMFARGKLRAGIDKYFF